MKLSVLLAFAFLPVVARTNVAQQIALENPLSPRIANYRISATLDPNTKTVTGHEVLTWRNTSSDFIREFQFHLYMNAFKDEKSTFMRERQGRGLLKAEKRGHIHVNSIRVVGGADLTKSMTFIQPDDSNADDQTVMEVDLPTPVRPGKTIQLEIDFVTKLPRVVARSGYKGNFFFVGQWFPKIGVYGRGGWNCHQYHAHSEFFADFGVYDVNITVPRNYVVGATGSLQNERLNGDSTKTLTYRAEDVHDFAWTASPDFKVFTDRWHHVHITFLCLPDHVTQAQRHLDIAKQALQFFHDSYGEYPYPTLTIVDVADSRAGGMEYPTLITAGFSYRYMPRGFHWTEIVVGHEFGHQYWYGMVASNEFEEPWLDEGINSYSEMKLMEKLYGKGSFLELGELHISDLDFQRHTYLSAPDWDPILRKAWGFYSGRSYGVGAYSKPALMLLTLENYLGPEVMGRILKTYFERWKFKHPTTQDFIAIAEEVSGQDLNWYFDQVLHGSEVLDYEVSLLRSRPAHQAGKDTTGKKKTELFDSEVRVRRLGGVRFPIEVEMTFENGEKRRKRWGGQGRWAKFTITKPARIVSAVIDPDRKIALELSRLNNSRTLKPQRKGVNKLALRWLFWMQNVMMGFEFFN